MLLNTVYCLIVLLFVTPAKAQEVNWRFDRVIDGDTIAFIAEDFPKTLQRVSIRVDGIDTPESTYRAQCDKEKAFGLHVKAYVVGLARTCDIRAEVTGYGKYGGRALGNVYFCGTSLKDLLLDRGYARPYDGGKKHGWC